MKFFTRKKKAEIPPMPSWETIVKLMYDKELDAYADEVVKVIYSKDRSKRYVILKDKKAFFTYQLEAIYQYDDDEWKYNCTGYTLPATWEPYRGFTGITIFGCIEELLKEMRAEPEYKQYFE